MELALSPDSSIKDLAHTIAASKDKADNHVPILSEATETLAQIIGSERSPFGNADGSFDSNEVGAERERRYDPRADLDGVIERRAVAGPEGELTNETKVGHATDAQRASQKSEEAVPLRCDNCVQFFHFLDTHHETEVRYSRRI